MVRWAAVWVTASSEEVASEERIAWWRVVLATTLVPFEVSADPDGFRAELRADTIGAVEISDIDAGPQVARCTARTISRADQDYYKFALQLRGSCVVSQDGRQATLSPGDLVVYDCTRPLELSFDESFRMLAFMFPRNRLGLPPRVVDAVTARRISGTDGTAGVVVPFLKSLAEQRDRVPPHTAHRLADTALDLLAALVDDLSGNGAAHTDPAIGAFMMRVQHYIDQNLGNPDLSPEQIATAHHISVRYLYKLFHTERTGVARYIRERRLEQCRRDLADHRLRSKPVGVVAARWGFLNAAHFSRLFKATYDASPREYRLRCGAAQCQPPSLSAAAAG
ncbi:MAG TPA: helix-turn-helix domain-containing protein [Mycobacterium sp.]|nr:helix-turn-helix domain-containing protein [Mycobacterium sp.]